MGVGTLMAAGLIDRPLVEFGALSRLDQRTVEYTIPDSAVDGDTIDLMVLPKDVRIIDTITDILDAGATDMELMLQLAALPGGSQALEVQATGTLTGTTIAADDTVNINGVEYTYVAALSEDPAVAYEVLVGASDSASLDNLIAAINGAAGEGTTYGEGTVAHPDVTAAAGAGDTMVVTSVAKGLAANEITTVAALSAGDWGAATLTGGSGRIVSTSRAIVTPTVLRRDAPGQPLLDDAYVLQAVLTGDDQDAAQRIQVTAIFEYAREP